MTRLEKVALDFIRDELARTDGVAPSFAEIAAATGRKSKSGAARLVASLEAQALIVRRPGKVRNLALPGADLSHATDAALLAEVARRGLLAARPRHA